MSAAAAAAAANLIGLSALFADSIQNSFDAEINSMWARIAIPGVKRDKIRARERGANLLQLIS